MFKCLKCDEIVADGSRICRKCGSIIDEVPDPEEESFVVAEPVPLAETADEEVDAEPPRARVDHPPDQETPEQQWQCANCSAEVPVHFLICWQCQHPRSIHESSTQETGTQETGTQETGTQETSPRAEIPSPVESVMARATLICPKCSSDDLVPNARVHVVAEGRLQVILEADTNAAEIPGLLTANVCERCGYVELRASNL